MDDHDPTTEPRPGDRVRKRDLEREVVCVLEGTQRIVYRRNGGLPRSCSLRVWRQWCAHQELIRG